MPNLNEFLGPKPTQEESSLLEKVIGVKPCSKCDADVEEASWDPVALIMSWECPNGHSNTIKVN